MWHAFTTHIWNQRLYLLIQARKQGLPQGICLMFFKPLYCPVSSIHPLPRMDSGGPGAFNVRRSRQIALCPCSLVRNGPLHRCKEICKIFFELDTGIFLRNHKFTEDELLSFVKTGPQQQSPQEFLGGKLQETGDLRFTDECCFRSCW